VIDRGGRSRFMTGWRGSRRTPLAIGVVIGALFLWLALRQADLGAAVLALGRADPHWCLAVFAAGPLFMAIKTWRWSWILRPIAAPRFNLLQRATYVGSAANMVVPGTGELLRTMTVARTGAMPLATALGTVALERILDLLAVVMIGGVVLVVGDSRSSLLWQAGLVGLGIAALGFVMVLLLPDPPRAVRAAGRRVAVRLPAVVAERLRLDLQRLAMGVAALRGARRLAAAVGLSVLMWLPVVFAVWASARAVGVAATAAAAVTVFVLGVIGLTLPSAPATLGTTQLAFVSGLALGGVEAGLALAASLVYTVWFIVAVMAIGAAWWLLSSSGPWRAAG
jgi:uncharacterized protein (TIRG00374 family)